MFRQYLEMKDTTRQLKLLSDRELEDIGFTRADIADIEANNTLQKAFNDFATRVRKTFFQTDNEYVDRYLSQSVDRVDLERREKELVKRGYLAW